MNNPAFQEMNDAREGLRLAWERAAMAIEPYIDECIKLETTETEMNVLAYMARPNQWTDWPWAKELNAEIVRQVCDRLYRKAMLERYTRVAEEQLRESSK